MRMPISEVCRFATPWGRVGFISFYPQLGMNDAVSSLQFGATSDEVGGAILLFEHAKYFGQYRSYIPTPGRETSVHYVGDDFNDCASSSIIVRRFSNELPPVSLGSLVPKSLVIDIVSHIENVSPDGDPIYTWDMWPVRRRRSPERPRKHVLFG